MTKPLVYNYRKAEDRIKELEGEIIRLQCDLDYYKRKCEMYRDEIRKSIESRPGASLMFSNSSTIF